MVYGHGSRLRLGLETQARQNPAQQLRALMDVLYGEVLHPHRPSRMGQRRIEQQIVWDCVLGLCPPSGLPVKHVDNLREAFCRPQLTERQGLW